MNLRLSWDSLYRTIVTSGITAITGWDPKSRKLPRLGSKRHDFLFWTSIRPISILTRSETGYCLFIISPVYVTIKVYVIIRVKPVRNQQLPGRWKNCWNIKFLLFFAKFWSVLLLHAWLILNANIVIRHNSSETSPFKSLKWHHNVCQGQKVAEAKLGLKLRTHLPQTNFFI